MGKLTIRSPLIGSVDQKDRVLMGLSFWTTIIIKIVDRPMILIQSIQAHDWSLLVKLLNSCSSKEIKNIPKAASTKIPSLIYLRSLQTWWIMVGKVFILSMVYWLECKHSLFRVSCHSEVDISQAHRFRCDRCYFPKIVSDFSFYIYFFRGLMNEL